jgi:homoisocitrate dehydrogenase
MMKRLSTLLSKPVVHRIGVIPGDGLGAEVMPWAKAVMQTIDAYAPVSYELIDLEAGLGTYQKHGTAIPDETLNELKKCQGSLFGAAATPSPPPFGYLPPVVEMRTKLGLYANLRPMQSVPIDVLGTRGNVDIVVVRENTECLYVGKEKLATSAGSGKLAIAERHISEKASKAIAKVAFDLAVERSKKRMQPGHVTIVHKANVLRLSEGLFLESCQEVAKNYPDVVVDVTLLDSFMYKSMAHPSEYDVVLSTNTWGNIISNGMSPMVGGLGMVHGINLGDDHVMAEPIHGTPAHLEGKDIANPLAAMRAAAGLAERLSPEYHFGEILERAILEVLKESTHLTRDIGGTASTHQCGEETIRHFKTLLSQQY